MDSRNKLRPQSGDQGHKSPRKRRKDIGDCRNQVGGQESGQRSRQRVEGRPQVLPECKARQHVAERRLDGCEGAGQRGSSLLCSGPRDAQVVLNHLDSVNDGAERHILDRFGRHLDSVPQNAGIIDEPGHFLLGTAVAELEVVQHGVVVFREALVGILDRLHAGAHFVGVVRHLYDGLVGIAGRGLRVAAEPLQQRGRKARHLFHVVVGRHARRAVSFVCRCNDLAGAVLEQRLHTAQALLQGCALGQGLAQRRADAGGCDDAFYGVYQLATDALPGAAGFPAQGGSNGALDALGRGHDLHIGAGHGVVVWHQGFTSSNIARRAASKSSPEA